MWKTAWDLLRETYVEWVDDKGDRLGAALAFYSVLSLAPLLVIVIAIAAAVFGREAARGEIVSQIDGLVGRDGAQAVQEMIIHSQQPATGIVAVLLGVGTLFLGAAGVFGELQDALNTIWEVPTKPSNGIWLFIKKRFFSFAMVFGTGFLLLASLAISTTLQALSEFMNARLSLPAAIWLGVDFLISFGVITLLFGLIFKVVPDVKIAWKDVWIGAVLTALLFIVGKFLLGLYLGRSGLGSAYGAAGSLIVLVVWIYYSAQILFFGAEFTQVYAKRSSSLIADGHQRLNSPVEG